MNPTLKKLLIFLQKVTNFIIFTVALGFTACFFTVKFHLITIAFVVLNLSIMTAQFIDNVEVSSYSHGSWITVYLLFILFFRSLEDSPLVGLLDNDLTRMVYQPSAEERERALFRISLTCWVIVTMSYFVHLALDKCLALAIDQEEDSVDDVEAVQRDQSDVESAEEAVEEGEGTGPKSILKTMFDDTKGMLIKPLEISGVKKSHEKINALYKKMIGEPIVQNVNKGSVRSDEFEAMLQVVQKYLKALNNSYKKTIAEPIYKCNV
jgi:hypothetical protein